jgi:hypothetical protein
MKSQQKISGWLPGATRANLTIGTLVGKCLFPLLSASEYRQKISGDFQGCVYNERDSGESLNAHQGDKNLLVFT